MNRIRAWIFGGDSPALRTVVSQEQFLALSSGERDVESVSSAVDAYNLVSWVYRCANLRAMALSAIPVEFWRGDVQLDAPPVPVADMAALLRDIEMSLCLHGAAYVLKQTRGRTLVGLQLLNAATVSVKADPFQGITAFEQHAGSTTLKFAPEQMVYIRLYNAADDVGPGRAPARVALQAAQLAHNANRYVARFFENGAIPAVVLTTEQAMTETDAERVRTVWQKMFGGVARAWRTAILQRGLEPRVIGSQAKDLSVAPLLSEARQQIAVAFGIPQTLLEDAANFATAREHKLSFYYETVFPQARIIASAFNAQLFSQTGVEMRFDFNAVEAVQQDEATKAAALAQLVQLGIISSDEAREELGYEPRARASEAAPAEATQPAEAVPAEAARDLARWREKARRAVKRSGSGDVDFESEHIPPWLYAAIRRRLVDMDVQAAFAPALRAFSQDKAERALQEKLNGVYSKHVDKIAKRAASGEMPDAELDALADDLTSTLVAQLTLTVADAALDMGIQVGVGFEYDELLSDAAQWAKQYTYDLVKGIKQTQVAHLQNVISQLVDGKLTRDDAVAMIEPLFGPVRAGMIATTETTRAMSQATELYTKQLRETGHDVVERWLTAEDERVCDVCGPLDHTLEDVWRPQFPSGPPAHVGCRCKTVVEVRRGK